MQGSRQFANEGLQSRWQIGHAGICLDAFHNGAADDDAVGDARDLGYLFRGAYAESDCQRKIRELAHAICQRGGCIGKRFPLACDAGSGNKINKTRGVFGHQTKTPFGAGGGGQEYRIKTLFAQAAYRIFGFFHA